MLSPRTTDYRFTYYATQEEKSTRHLVL
ncbi:hypothetical protein VTJ04DRAFT_1300 [Mycothermus thermophilus]